MSSSSDDEKALRSAQSGDSEKAANVIGKALERSPSANETDALPAGALDPVYAAKAEVLNRAIQQIGFGRYQVRLERMLLHQ